MASCRDLGYIRGTMVNLEGLGDANIAAGRFEAAEQAFIEGMATADKMGMVRDMLGMMAKIAKVRAARGLPAEAVEMLATVLAQPISAQQPFTDNTPHQGQRGPGARRSPRRAQPRRVLGGTRPGNIDSVRGRGEGTDHAPGGRTGRSSACRSVAHGNASCQLARPS